MRRDPTGAVYRLALAAPAARALAKAVQAAVDGGAWIEFLEPDNWSFGGRVEAEMAVPVARLLAKGTGLKKR